ncbi:major facilitator super [Pseudozyma hubeiensis SY62]|uniref:Major facilitator super n=1 Tax=Pseudozyma hubeiensis (strain SY62) TaxID=1305764 RepID=R9P313_PSEHS|nr:major facilitator super [Pseudozyma hubeiensis SY62]GAC95694.1 major facilitator super [Pseudozyma hubeiensis SY62]
MLTLPPNQVHGRRPIYISTFLIFVLANIGLSFTTSYPVLLVLRVFQAVGACSAIAIGAGTIADVTEPNERGSYMGYYALAQYTGLAIGPVIGGALSRRWDYHATFFFLTALSGPFLIFMVLCLVETLRSIVGNGSALVRGIYRPLLQPRPVSSVANSPRPPMKHPLSTPQQFGFLQPFLVFTRPETSLAIIAYSIVYASYYLSSASLPYLFKKVYGLDELWIGVSFVPSGVGCVVGTVLAGKILDWDYRRAVAKGATPVRMTRVRLQSAWIYLPCYSVSLLAYGWSVGEKLHIALPVVFQFAVGFFSIMYFTNINTLIVDLYPGKAASATAAVNLGRCVLGAGAVAVVQPMIAAVGAGWTFTVGAVLTLFIGLVCQALIYLYGEIWAAAGERTQ